jgi:hypothetical protein
MQADKQGRELVHRTSVRAGVAVTAGTQGRDRRLDEACLPVGGRAGAT